MTTKLQEMRETWRPRLAHDVIWMCRLIVPAAIAASVAAPEIAMHMVGLTLAVFGFAASLLGLRQWGKNSGAE